VAKETPDCLRLSNADAEVVVVAAAAEDSEAVYEAFADVSSKVAAAPAMVGIAVVAIAVFERRCKTAEDDGSRRRMSAAETK